MNDNTRIEEPRIERDAKGKIKMVGVVFGPHHFVDVYIEEGRVVCSFGATHHGVKFNASEVGGEFEQFIEAVKRPLAGKVF